MPNLSFDYGMPPGDDDRDAPDPPMTVAMLSQRIEAALAQGLPANIRVEGEVANAVVRNSHQYFSLREPDASISCVMWASDAQRCTHDLRDGDRVIAVGSVVHWARAGRTQLRVRRIEPVGEGELLATFRARCDTLREQGYFDPSARKPLPACPRRIAVLTSATGAAVHDVVATAKRRFPACGLLLVDVPVQGPTAAARIAAAIRRVDRAHKSLCIDAIILTRGGGSLEDLWAFNELVLAEAVHRCSVPIVAAIGHESDVTIAELVADARCATPTAAAAALLPDRDEARARLGLVDRSLDRAVRARLAETGARVTRCRHALGSSGRTRVRRGIALIDALRARLQGLQPGVVLARRRHRLQQLGHRLQVATRDRVALGATHVPWARLSEALTRRLALACSRLDLLERALEAVNPEAVLARGFSLTMDEQGRLIRRADEVRVGQLVHTRTAKGSLHSRVESSSTQD